MVFLSFGWVSGFLLVVGGTFLVFLLVGPASGPGAVPDGLLSISDTGSGPRTGPGEGQLRKIIENPVFFFLPKKKGAGKPPTGATY